MTTPAPPTATLAAAGDEAADYVEACIWTPRDGAYPLGSMREGLGWVSEELVCRGAESNRDHIYFLRWKREAGE